MSSALRTLAAARWPASAVSRPRQSLVQAAAGSASSCFGRPRPLGPSRRGLVGAAAAATGRLIVKPAPPPAARGFASASPRTSPATAAFSSSSAPSAAASSSSSSAPSSTRSALDWNSFFKLRLRRRRIQIGFSVATGLAGGVAGAAALSSGLAEPLVMQIPLDPFFTLGLMTLACVGMGWLIGPSIGGQVFYLLNRQYKGQIMQKESEFFARIKNNRADPSNSSAGNPVPDFYGEKIQSVSGYRRWLKDQRAFNKKKTANFV